MRELLIDGDILIYKIAAASEQNIDWGDGIHTLHADDREGQKLVTNTVAKYLDRLAGDRAYICLSSKSNWRNEVLPTYKENRKDVRRPMILKALRAYLRAGDFDVKLIEGLEADDIMGIMATTPRNTERIIVSDDKDMLSIPTTVYRPMSDVVTDVDLATADYNFYTQCLTGDRTDNYMGCPTIGKARAARILEEPTWASVVAAYEKQNLTEDDALIQARVARICRWEDFNKETKEVILWKPQQ